MRKIQVENTIYEVDDDFRTAIRCNQIAEDETIGDFERALGVLVTLFGEKAIDNTKHYEKLLKWAKKYLSCGNENISIEQEPTMDYIQDEKYIKSSFKYDYGYNPYEMEHLSWEEFYNDLNNLSNSEFGNCCILNRIIQIRTYDVSKVQDAQERDKILKAKQMVALKKKKKEVEIELTEDQQKSVDEFYKALGF